ncbi:MAG: hypothetical protein NT126_05480 [Bacteroidetes bacterium]|nr:hypothetical protein [Bacteroidota bacterium]
MKKIIRIEIIRQDEMFKGNDVYFIPEGVSLSEEDVKKFKRINPDWKVIAHCQPADDSFEVTI